MPLNPSKVAELRAALGMTQAQAAKSAGLRSQFWSDVEGGRRMNLTLDSLEAIARTLKCSPCDLLTAPPKAKRR